MMILFVTILCLPLMLMVSALAVDLGYFGVMKDKLQVAMDSAAVAGASSISFKKDEPTCTKDCLGSWVMSEDVVRAYAALNGFSNPTIRFDPTRPAVQVRYGLTIQTSLLRLIGINTLPVVAVAEAVRFNIAQSDKDSDPPTPGKSRLIQ